MAKELLLTSDMTVVPDRRDAELFQCAEFHPIFQQKVGMTPGKYRKDYQNEKRSEDSLTDSKTTRCVSGAVFCYYLFLCAVH